MDYLGATAELAHRCWDVAIPAGQPQMGSQGDFCGTAVYQLTVTDLAWRYYNDYQREKGSTLQEISSVLTSALKSSEVYLRIGLARGWEKFPDRCFVQITGVYTFPDYLNGQVFADLIPGANAA